MSEQVGRPANLNHVEEAELGRQLDLLRSQN